MCFKAKLLDKHHPKVDPIAGPHSVLPYVYSYIRILTQSLHYHSGARNLKLDFCRFKVTLTDYKHLVWETTRTTEGHRRRGDNCSSGWHSVQNVNGRSQDRAPRYASGRRAASGIDNVSIRDVRQKFPYSDPVLREYYRSDPRGCSFSRSRTTLSRTSDKHGSESVTEEELRRGRPRT